MPVGAFMKKTKKVLITGGSGMIGRRLTTLLLAKGYDVAHLGRSKRNSSVPSFLWDPAAQLIDTGALRDVDVIIHLAGASVADKRWNARRKQEILLSRTQSAELLAKTLKETDHEVRTFISSSGISYYGLDNPRVKAFVETDPPANDFMAGVTVAWEREVQQIADPAIRKVMIRTGVVLGREGGALKKLVTPVKYFVGAPLGTGHQYFNWIHLDDLCGIYMKAIEDPQMAGAFNAVAPNPVTNRELTRTIAHVLKRPLLLPPIPAFVVKLIAGDVAELVLRGGKIASEKIEKAGFEFRFRTVNKALEDLLA